MKRFKKNLDHDNHNYSEKRPDSDMHSLLVDPEGKSGYNPIRLMGIAVVCLMVISVLFSASVILKDPPSDGIREAMQTRVLQMGSEKGTFFYAFEGFKCWVRFGFV